MRGKRHYNRNARFREGVFCAGDLNAWKTRKTMPKTEHLCQREEIRNSSGTNRNAFLEKHGENNFVVSTKRYVNIASANQNGCGGHVNVATLILLLQQLQLSQ